MSWNFFKKRFSFFNINQQSVKELLEKGLSEHHAGNLEQAQQLYRAALNQAPDNSQALHLAGVIDYQRGLSESALNYIERAISIEPLKPEYFNSKGLVLLELDRDVEALTAFEKALELNPGGLEISLNMGSTLGQLGRVREAIDTYLKIIQLQPEHERAYCNLGNLYFQNEDYENATVCFNKALELNPDLVDVYPLLGNSLYKQENYVEAIKVLEIARDKLPDNQEIYTDLGNCYLELNRHKEAIVQYEKAIRLNPDYVVALKNIGVAYQEMGINDKATENYLQVLAIDPACSEVYHYLSVINHSSCPIDEIQYLIEDNETPDKDKMHCYFALGNCYSASRDFHKSFEYYLKANAIKRKTIRYDAMQNSDYISRIIKAYSTGLIDRFASNNLTTEMPVFIVGMPRSGTTLVEQIISSHSLVYGAGELTALARVELELEKMLDDKGGFPDSIEQLDDKQLSEMSNDYLSRLPDVPAGTLRITDKLPGNYLRIGLIKILFPNARIIHCVRNPLDTCLSIFTNYFADGYKYGYDLEELGKYYLDYERLMQHWNSLFQEGIYQVQYEELVADQRAISQQLIDYLGLDWEPRCLDFHENKRAVKTASNVQVRQPLYKNSIGKWKNFAGQLQPLKHILDGE